MTHSSTKNWKIENWRKCHSKQRLFKKWQFSSFFSAAERHSDHGLAVFARTCIRPNRSCLVQFCHVIVYPLPQKANSNVPKTFKLSLMCASHFEQSQPRPGEPLIQANPAQRGYRKPLSGLAWRWPRNIPVNSTSTSWSLTRSRRRTNQCGPT